MQDDNENRVITRTLVPEADRAAVVEDLFGVYFPLRLEPYIFAGTDQMVESYRGAYWDFYIVEVRPEERSFYMVPDIAEPVACRSANGWCGEMSADALGITVALTAYSHLSFSEDHAFGRLMATHYHPLREFMLEHEEVVAILGAID